MKIGELPKLNVLIADTPETQAKGLMFVKKMQQDHGMLFVFGSIQKLSFWGENTYIPLDIAFVDDRGFIKSIETINPLSRKTVSSSCPCKYAIEANLGYFADNDIKHGDLALINKSQGIVQFVKKNSKEFTSLVKNAQQITDDIIKKYPTLGEYLESLDKDKKPEEKQNQNLPVLTEEEIGKYIEDSIQDQKEKQEKEGLPPYVPPTIKELEPKTVDQLEREIPRFNNMSDAFNWAVQNKQVMKISYQTISKKRGLRYYGNRMIVRYIQPHGRFTSRPAGDISHEVLVTFDETVGDIRAFRLQNVREFSFVGREFAPKFIVR